MRRTPCGCCAPLARTRFGGAWGGWYTIVLLLQGVLICCFVKSTPSKGRHVQSPPTAAANGCATCKAAPIQRIAQQQRKEKHRKTSLPQCILAHLNNRRTTKKHAPYRTIPKHCTSASATGGATQCHHCTNLHARNPSPAPARSALNRTSSVTTGHQTAQCSIHLHSKIERRLPPSLLSSPSFSSPPCTALFFFSAHGEKEEGGASRFLKRKEPHRPRKGHNPHFLKRKTSRAPEGRNPHPPAGKTSRFPERKTPASWKGAIPRPAKAGHPSRTLYK